MLAWFNMSNNLCSTLGLITARQVFMSLPSKMLNILRNCYCEHALSRSERLWD